MFNLFKKEALPEVESAKPRQVPYEHKVVYMATYINNHVCPHCLKMGEAVAVADSFAPNRKKLRIVYEHSEHPLLEVIDRVNKVAGKKFGAKGIPFPCIIANGNVFVSAGALDHTVGIIEQIIHERE